uniref:E3 ubiquitin-protein ligase RNF10 n=1 Tax=Ciona savignyi TaxID=51511 RepID=H2Z6N5_CIOSA
QMIKARRDEYNSNSVESSNNKKVNLNHLLNFTYQSIEQDTGRHHHHKFAPKYSHFNKTQFIQANCQFIVKEGTDYSAHLADSDLPINWDLVEKVNMWACDAPSCPICLYEPQVAKITKCGHIFCWPCILHYLSLDTKMGRKCPICHEPVVKAELKSVSVYSDVAHETQCVVSMQLMKRERGSAVAIPWNLKKKFAVRADWINFQETRNLKFLISSANQVKDDIVNLELGQLNFKLATETDFSTTLILFSVSVYSDVAHETQCVVSMQLMKRERGSAVAIPVFLISSANQVKDDIVNLELGQLNFKLATETDVRFLYSLHILLILYNSSVLNPELEKIYIELAVELCKERMALLTASIQGADVTWLSFNYITPSSSPANQFYYFYQSKDGQHIYLHPINTKCLMHQYGSLENCPTEITAKIMEMEGFTMNEATRKRHRYLWHLPISLEFRIAELDLRPPLVTTATLAFFRESLERRAGQRKKRARDEKRVLRRAQNEQMRKEGKYPAARICLESQKQFPRVHASNPGGSFSVLLSSPGTTPCSESSLASYITSAPSAESCELRDTPSPLSSVGSLENSSAGLSFAQMLRNTQEHPTWPKLETISRPPVAALSSPDPNEEEVDPNYVPPPSYKSSFGDDLCTALDQLGATGKGEKQRKKGKGKRGKKLLLFSTAGQQHQ